MVRDGGLGKTNLLNNLIDGQPAATALAHNLLACLVGNRLGKEHRICFHRRLSMGHYIEVYLFVKRQLWNLPKCRELELVKVPCVFWILVEHLAADHSPTLS